MNSFNRLNIMVKNTGSSDFQGSVVVDIGAKYVREAFVQAGKDGSLTFYLPPMEYSSWASGGSLTIKVSLYDERDKIVAQTKVTPYNDWSKVQGFSSAYLGVMGKPVGEFRRISNVFDNVSVVQISPSDLDYLPFAENFRAIILSNPSSLVFSSEQIANLRQWLEGGGLLILGGGSSAIQSAASLPPDLLPLRSMGTERVFGGELGQLGLNPPGTDSYTIATGELAGQVFAEAGGKPLLVAKEVGGGTVLWSALDLEAPPFLDATQAEAFWQRILTLHPIEGKLPINTYSINQFFHLLSYDHLAASISTGNLFLLLLGYVALVGPINWLILRKIDRREWAWFIIPALALLLTGAAFAYGRFGRGSDKILYQINVVEAGNNTVHVKSLNGVFIPSSRRINLTSAADLLPYDEAITAKTVEGRQIIEIKDAHLWSVQKFYGAQQVLLPGSVAIDIDYTMQTGVDINLTNNSGQDFFDSYLKLGKNWYRIGHLPHGSKKKPVEKVGPNLEAIFSHYGVSGANIFWQDFYSLVQKDENYFLGFGDQGLFPVAQVDQTVALDLWLQPVTVKDFQGVGSFNVPEGVLIPWSMGAFDTVEQQDYHFSGENEQVDMIFKMPPDLDYTQGKYLFNLERLWGQLSQGEIYLFNNKEGIWQKIGKLDVGDDLEYLLENLEECVIADRLLIRLSFNGELVVPWNGAYLIVDGGRFND